MWAWTGPDAAFERGKVDRIESHKGVVHVKLANGKMVEAREDTVHLANNANQDGVADNTELRQLNEATLLHNIRVRYAKDEGGCYTVTGHILIAVNPFKQLGIYDEKQVSAFPSSKLGAPPISLKPGMANPSITPSQAPSPHCSADQAVPEPAHWIRAAAHLCDRRSHVSPASRLWREPGSLLGFSEYGAARAS